MRGIGGLISFDALVRAITATDFSAFDLRRLDVDFYFLIGFEAYFPARWPMPRQFDGDTNHLHCEIVAIMRAA